MPTKVKCGLAPLKDGERYGTAIECSEKGQVRRYGKIKFDKEEVERKRFKKKEAQVQRSKQQKAAHKAKVKRERELKRLEKLAEETAAKTLKDIAANKTKAQPDVRYTMGIASFDDKKARSLAKALLSVPKDAPVQPKQPNRSLSKAAFNERGWDFIMDYGEFLRSKLASLNLQQRSALLYASKNGLRSTLNFINSIIPSFPPAKSKFWDYKYPPADYIQAIVEEYLPK
jgi:hypothetical protein